jgi:hypothetical protein
MRNPPLDYVENEETGYMTPDGWHVETDREPDNYGKTFYDPSLTAEENALLNLEVTPEIEEILYLAAKDKGTLTDTILVEEELDDTQSTDIKPGVDYERLLEKAIPFLDNYISLSRRLDKAMDKLGWLDLTTARKDAWERFLEEMDWNWFALDQWDAKGDARLLQLAALGEEPNPEGWNSFLSRRAEIIGECEEYQSARISKTYPLYQTALKATEACRSFWKSAEGKAINILRERRREAFLALQQPIVGEVNSNTGETDPNTTGCGWDVRFSYFKLMEEDISRTYLSTNDNSGVDDPDEQVVQKDTMEGYLDTHLLEEWKNKTGDIRAVKDYDKWFNWNENRMREVSSLMESIDNEI